MQRALSNLLPGKDEAYADLQRDLQHDHRNQCDRRGFDPLTGVEQLETVDDATDLEGEREYGSRGHRKDETHPPPADRSGHTANIPVLESSMPVPVEIAISKEA